MVVSSKEPPHTDPEDVIDDDGADEDEVLGEVLLRHLISEIIRKCGKQWCLYTKHVDKKTGHRRRLGTHSSRSAAERQERAVKRSQAIHR